MLLILDTLKEYAPIGTLLIAGVGLASLFVAISNLNLASCKNEFDIFMKLDEKYNTLLESMASFISAGDNEKEGAEYQVKQAMERYFNTLDTICLYVLKKNISRQIFYRQYGELILQLSEQELYKEYFTENDKGYYENIQKVVKELKKQNK